MGLQHQFSRALSGSVNYTFTTAASERAADTLAHAASATLGYSLDPSRVFRCGPLARLSVEAEGGQTHKSRTHKSTA